MKLLILIFIFSVQAWASPICEKDLGSKGGAFSPPVTKIWRESNPYVTRPSFADQARFLIQMGVKITDLMTQAENPRQIIMKYNARLDQLIASGKVGPDEAIFGADTYVNKKGLLVFVRMGDPAPVGTTPLSENQMRKKKAYGPRDVYFPANNHTKDAEFAGLLSDFDYHLAISQGLFPVDLTAALVRGSSDSQGEPIFFHELAHLGGFLTHLQGMKAFRQAAKALVTRYPEGPPKIIGHRLFFVNEVLSLFGPGAFQDLRALLESFKIEFCSDDPSEYEANCVVLIRDQLARLPAQDLIDLVGKLNKFNSTYRKPFGAIARTAGSNLSTLSRMDILSQQLGGDYFLSELKKPTSDISAQLKMAQYISAALNLSRTDIQGWFDLALSTELPPKGPFFRYLCGAHTEGDNWAKDFCSDLG
jgi:hypothetical protein